MKTWEYTTFLNEPDFKVLGIQGWELVSVIYMPTVGMKYYFKRRIT